MEDKPDKNNSAETKGSSQAFLAPPVPVQPLASAVSNTDPNPFLAGPNDTVSESQFLRKRKKRDRVPSSDRYISHFSDNTKRQYRRDCKQEERGRSTKKDEETLALLPKRAVSRPDGTATKPAVAVSVTPVKLKPKSYFPSPPQTSSSTLSGKNIISTPSTPSKKHASLMNDWKKIAIANPSLFYAQKPFASAASYSLSSKPRDISQSPDLVLDAPRARDDYYTTLLDWAPSGNLMVGLDTDCYIWNKSGLLAKMTTTQSDDYICSVRFSPSGDMAAVGSDRGIVKIFDVAKSHSEPQAVFCVEDFSILAWKSETHLVTGELEGTIKFWDIRTHTQPTRLLQGFHKDKVCGLARSPDSLLIASGCNGGVVNIWDDRRLDKPLWAISCHTSAVRALAWCPWQPSLLASGGGLDDEFIHFHNTDTGKLVRSLHTGSQVCDILWSQHYKEFISCHSSSLQQLVIWKYPSLEKVATLPGHQNRPLHLALSPDGQTVASLGDDEHLKFWKCFETPPGQKKLAHLKTEAVPALTIR